MPWVVQTGPGARRGAGGLWRSLACSRGSSPSQHGQMLGTARAQSLRDLSSVPPCPPASFPPLASLPWALALAPSCPPDTASSSSDADSGLRFFCTHHCELLCARPMLGKQGELGRGLVGEAAKHHVHSRSTSSSSFLPRAPAWSSRASPAILFQAPGLSPHSITPHVIRCLVWTTLLSIWPIKLRASHRQICVSRVAQCFLCTQPGSPHTVGT